MNEKKRPGVVLIIGELESRGHEGVLVDVRGTSCLGVQHRLVPTAIRTAKEHHLDRDELDRESVIEQLSRAVASGVDAIKSASVGGEALLRGIAELFDTLGERRGACVLDARAVHRSGDTLLSSEAIEAFRDHLMRWAELVVVNVDEVELLTGRRALAKDAMRDGARRLGDLAETRVLVTGGRTEGHAVDVLYDGSGFLEFGADRVEILDERQLRGAGESLTSCIAAAFAREQSLPEAIDLAKKITTRAIKDATEAGPFLLCDPMAPRYRALGVQLAVRS